MDGRVGALSLKIRAPRDRLVQVSPSARHFATRVIRRCDARLEARARGRVILVRRLEMIWRLLERALERDGEVEAFAEEMAEALSVQAEGAAAAPSPADNLVVFADEAHWRAAHLAAVARGEPTAWYFARLADEGEPPGRLRRPEHRALAAAVLTRLAEDGSLPRVLARLPTVAVRDLARSLDVDAPSSEDEEARPLPFALMRAALGAALRADRGPTREADPAAGPSAVAPTEARGLPAVEPATPVDVITTRFGGLFYLVARCLELDLGDILWQVCLAEGAVLSHAAAALLGPAAAGDPAPALFGGVTGEPPLPVVSSEQHAETASALVASLAAAFPRRGLATLPDTVLGLVEHSSGRLLVAVMPDQPFVLFAWPAPEVRALVAGIHTFLAGWPSSGPPPRAVPELAELDRSGRLRPSRRAVISPSLVLPRAAASPHAVALVAQVGGALGGLFVGRIGQPGRAGSDHLVDDFLAIPGEIELAPESMTVRLPLERVDLRVRRAGLDADPGWVPWLGRRVRIVFAEAQRGDPAITREA
jgi:hypothetical protein